MTLLNIEPLQNDLANSQLLLVSLHFCEVDKNEISWKIVIISQQL